MFRDLLLPSRCAACNTEGRGPLCRACEEQVPWIAPPLCLRCGLPARESLDECDECRGRFAFASARAAARYEGPARRALKAFKLSGERRQARALARPMLEALDASRYDVVTFVPATRRSVLERGFNPAEDLARPLAKAMRVPLRALLSKTRETQDQAGLGPEERRQNLAGAFTSSPANGRVLLVDDVFTTGATADACARTLLDAGAEQVNVVTFARAGRAGRAGRTGRAQWVERAGLPRVETEA